jgi:diguanylate cyclase (GGDEF)-like protein/putative nucleotidyltransferase with HDIG domain
LSRAGQIDRAVTARFGAYILAAGGFLGLFLLALPHESRPSEIGIALTAVAALMGAAVLVIGYDRIPDWMFQAMIAVGTGVISMGIYFQGNAAGPIVVLYVAIAVTVFYFFNWRQAALQLAWMGICYWIVLLQREIFTEAVQAWVETMGMIAVVGFLMGRIRQRIDWLVAKLQDAARTDALTGLLNRRGFEEQFALELERAWRSQRLLSVLIGDLDHFKDVNDRFGHHAGDSALVQIGDIFLEVARRIDVCARMGGEEFAFILPDTDEHGAFMLAERLRNAVRDAFASQPVSLTISFGVASFPGHGETAEPLLRSADQALYAAKALGRDRSVIQSPEIAGTLSGANGPSHTVTDGHLATVIALAETLDVRDAGTAKHSQTVGRLAELTARELGLPLETVERVRLAGILHDVGKVGVPDSVLKKPGPLTDDEWTLMRKHPEIAARILEGADMDDIREWVFAHQERPDGEGYPRGLQGDDIPLEARILAVADAYEAMVSERVYRPALTPEAAQLELLQCSGSQFDPVVVRAFLKLLTTEGTETRPETKSKAA